jgi:hypothetical protein
MDDIESLKAQAAYHYRAFSECMGKMFELDECAASGFQEYLETIGGV